MNIEVLKYRQKDKDIFIFSAEPNYIKKLVKISDISAGDDNFQRPFDPKRIIEIRNYVSGKDKLYKKGKEIYAKGYIPNAIVLNLSSRYKLTESDKKFYLNFPDTESVSKFKESIEIIDGQHRLLAFNEECVHDLEKQPYLMCFVAFINLSSDEKKEIFMVLNERQKTVDKNILLRHKKLLNLLLDEEETRYEVIAKLNDENDSPFYNRVIMAGEKKKNAFKASSIDEILSSSKALDKLIDSKNQISVKHYKVFKNYLNAWQQNFKGAWADSKNTLSKVSGVRFMFYLFPSFYEVLKMRDGGKDFQVSAFSAIVQELKNNHFNDSFDLKKAGKFQFFQDKTSIGKLANTLGKELVEQYQDRGDDILV
ncbi:MAG: DGQHR domain-containing protein [Deltaproteobacteria bacterium]|nr:DGQHR domain-containing protein [Deltaproteobacteria bacterium]